MTRLYKVSVLFQHKLDLSVAEGTQLDVVYYAGGQGALGQSGQVLDNVLGLEKDKNRFCVQCTVGNLQRPGGHSFQELK